MFKNFEWNKKTIAMAAALGIVVLFIILGTFGVLPAPAELGVSGAGDQ